MFAAMAKSLLANLYATPTHDEILFTDVQIAKCHVQINAIVSFHCFRTVPLAPKTALGYACFGTQSHGNHV